MSLSALEAADFGPGEPGTPSRTSLGDRLASRYRMLQPLGFGAASRVFLARDERTKELVAVKVMPPFGSSAMATEERFDAEVAVGRSVPHPNVAQVLDSGTSEWNEPFVVTEALRGETLGERLRRERTLPPHVAVALARDAASGLAAIHRAGYVHRDVKPDNLFLCDERRHGAAVKVIDFGFSTLVDHADEASRRVMGTLEYIAPEQALAEGVDGRADVYALGVVLFRAITGELPFDVSARRGILTHHLISPLPPASWLVEDLDAGIEQVVRAATRKHPDNRYTCMEEFAADLEAVLEGAPAHGAAPRIVPDVYRPKTDRGRLVLDALRGEI